MAGVVEETSQPRREEEAAREEKNARAAKEEAERAAKANAEQSARVARACETARQRDKAEDWQAFLAEFPDSPHRDEILSRIFRLAAAAQATAVSGLRRGVADFIDTILIVLMAAGFTQYGTAVVAGAIIVCGLLACFRISRSGKTPGHQLTGTRILDEQGNRLSYGRSVIYLIAWLPIGTFFLGFGTLLTVRYTQQHVALYDLFARIKVVRNTR